MRHKKVVKLASSQTGSNSKTKSRPFLMGALCCITSPGINMKKCEKKSFYLFIHDKEVVCMPNF